MRHPAGSVLLLLINAVFAPAEEASLADCMPEGIPGGREAAANALAGGAPHQVLPILRDIQFAQDPPRFLPWKVALSGGAASEVMIVWETYSLWLIHHGIDCTEFHKDVSAWLESCGDMDPARSARISTGLFCESGILAKRHEALARAGNGHGMMSLAGNPSGHAILQELCGSQHLATSILANKVAAFSRATAFREHFVRGAASKDPQVRLHCTSGLLRLGDPKDVGTLRSYLQDPKTIRRFEVYEAAVLNPSPEVLDLLLSEIPHASGVDAGFLASAIGRFKDPRVLPKLRELSEMRQFIHGVDRALWHCGRAGDVPFLLRRLKGENIVAAEALRRLLGRAMPLVADEWIPAVQRWMEEHKAEVEADAELIK